MLESLKHLVRFLGSLRHSVPGSGVAALGLTVAFSLVEGAGLVMLIPLLGLVGVETGATSVGRIGAAISSGLAVLGLAPSLITVLGIYLLIVLAHAALGRVQMVAICRLQSGYVLHLRRHLYRAIMGTRWSFFSASRASDFLHVVTAEVERLGMAAHELLVLTAHLFMVPMYLWLAFHLSAGMTALVLLCGLLGLILLRDRLRPAVLTGEDLSLAMSGLYASASDHLAGVKTARSYGVEERSTEIFLDRAGRIARLEMDTVAIQARARFWFEVGTVSMLTLLLYLSIEVATLEAAEILLLVFLFARLMPRFSGIQQGYQQLSHLLPAFSAVSNLRERCEAGSDPAPAGGLPVVFRDTVRLHDLSFSYPDRSDRPALSGVNLEVPKGVWTGVVGPSGSGKTTVADLVLGLLTPTAGSVLVDDVPLTPERLQSWRERIGYVTQETFLFHGTLRENLMWASPAARGEELPEALRLSAAQDFVQKLPQGLDTLLGDGGRTLSGGERQRLALARALLRKPRLLVLDEATSSLDLENETRILEALRGLAGRLTILFITHRLSAVRQADRIYLLGKGRILDHGGWEELVRRGRFPADFAGDEVGAATPVAGGSSP